MPDSIPHGAGNAPIAPSTQRRQNTTNAGRAPTALEVAGLTVSRYGTPVLADIDLALAPGECLAVVGPSGAGKSVLSRTLLGLPQCERGWQVTARSLRIVGEELRSASEGRWRQVRGSRIALVLQDALQSLDPLRPIGAEVGETLAAHGQGGSWRRSPGRPRIIRALTAAGLPDAERRLRQRSPELSGGMRQRALIASALVAVPDIVIADEPITALDPVNAERVIKLFREARDSGTAVVWISHDLHSVARIADRVAVLEGGRIVELGLTSEVLERPQHPATQRLVGALRHPISSGATASRPASPDAATSPSSSSGRTVPLPTPDTNTNTNTNTNRRSSPALQLHDVTRSYPTPGGGFSGVADINLSVGAGDSLGIVGASGAGKSTLARLIVGADQPDGGTIARSGGSRCVRLIPQDPLATFDPRWRVGRILEHSLRLAHRAGSRDSPISLLDAVGLSADLLRRRPATLSGGQRQRVAVARALAASPDVLVCDEPVSALDAATQVEILALLDRLRRERGTSVVFISHDLLAVRALCDRVAVLHEGRIVECGETPQVFTRPQSAHTRALLTAAAGGAAGGAAHPLGADDAQSATLRRAENGERGGNRGSQQGEVQPHEGDEPDARGDLSPGKQ